MQKPNTKIFPFTLTSSSTIGLVALWLKYKPSEHVWTTVALEVTGPTSGTFTSYGGWEEDDVPNGTFPMAIRGELLVPHIAQRQENIVNAVFAYEEYVHEQERIAKRKAEIHAELFN